MCTTKYPNIFSLYMHQIKAVCLFHSPQSDCPSMPQSDCSLFGREVNLVVISFTSLEIISVTRIFQESKYLFVPHSAMYTISNTI